MRTGPESLAAYLTWLYLPKDPFEPLLSAALAEALESTSALQDRHKGFTTAAGPAQTTKETRHTAETSTGPGQVLLHYCSNLGSVHSHWTHCSLGPKPGPSHKS